MVSPLTTAHVSHLPVLYYDLILLDHALSFLGGDSEGLEELNALKSLIRKHQTAHEAYKAQVYDSMLRHPSPHPQAQRFHPYADAQRRRKCRRGGIAMREWEQMEETASTTSPDANALIGMLASSPDSKLEAWAGSLLRMSQNLTWGVEDSMSSVLLRCTSFTSKGTEVNFYLMVSQIQLAMKCQR